MLATASKTAGLNVLQFYEETYWHPGGTVNLNNSNFFPSKYLVIYNS